MTNHLGCVNGVPVVSAARVPWKPDDDSDVVVRCDSRGLVMFDGGGKSDAVIIEDRAIIWERTGERFRAFHVERRAPSDELRDIAGRLRRIALRTETAADRATLALLLHVGGIIIATAERLGR